MSLLLSGLVLAAAVTAAPWLARHGWMQLDLDHQRLAEYGVDVPSGLLVEIEGLAHADGTLQPLRGLLAFDLDAGHAPRDDAAGLAFKAGLRFRRTDLAEIAPGRLRLTDGGKLSEWALVDDHDRVWFTARAGFPQRPWREDTLAIDFIDVQAGPALADWSGQPALDGLSIGRMALSLGGDPLPGEKGSCPLNWPGTPGTEVDVELIDLYQLQAFCVLTPCDGGAADGDATRRVKLVPAVNLSNAGSADVPWVAKFLQRSSGGLELTHPYPQPDQHPMLIWNAYRVDADGHITQIGRSGLKHAFATENLNCDCNPQNNQILGPACTDRYDIASNDFFSSSLGPRNEVIAADGRWGRCGSVFDSDCDGVQNYTGSALENRLRVAEADLSVDRHPGARWFVDAWYVVRDDAELLNTMGWREFNPSFNGTAWSVPLAGDFRQGALIDQWLALAEAGELTARQRVQTAQGEFILAARAAPLGDGRWRYRYVLMNLSFSRPRIAEGSDEPNLRLLANPGFEALRIELAGAPCPTGLRVDAGDVSAPWSVACSAGALQLSAPFAADLEWGSLLSLSFEAADPGDPVASTACARPAPTRHAVTTLVPPPAPDHLFADGFDRCAAD